MSVKQFKKRGEEDMSKLTLLSNNDIEVGISKEKGNLKKLFLNRNNFGKWNGCESYLIIVDELKEKTYKDIESPLAISQKRYKIKGEEVVENLKEFKGADFLVKETWRLNNDSLSWRIEVFLKKDKKDRTIQIKQLIPYPDPTYGLGVWAAQSQFPTKIERLGGLHLAYGDICFGTVIPAVTLYKEKEDIGLTITKPFGLKTSKLAFFFQDYRTHGVEGVEIETTLLALRKDKPAVVEFIIHPHEGCWRPGLAWLYKKYPEYFDPPNKKVREIEGGYFLSHPFAKEKDIASMTPHKLKWEELHCIFPYGGEYAPQEKEWECTDDTWEACVNFNVETFTADIEPFDKSSSVSAGKLSVEVIDNHFKMVHRHKVKSLVYFQCGGDGAPPIQKKFPDSVAEDINGAPYKAWHYLMNSDPSTSYGKEVLDMIDRLSRVYPNMDGVFLDQLCYNALDFAHDDGITMYKNKPVYTLWHCYEKPVKKLADKLHQQGKLIFGNGAYNIEVQKDIDGIMAEGVSWLAGVAKYLCICKPLLFLSFYWDNAFQAESMFHQCLLCGASYSLWPNPSEEVKKVLNTYIPLVEKLYGRKWLLEPNPIKLPESCDGNIFLGEKGDIIITVVSKRKSILDEKGIEKNLKIYVQFKGASKIKKAYSLGTHYQGKMKVKIQKEGNKLKLIVPEHSAATVIILEK